MTEYEAKVDWTPEEFKVIKELEREFELVQRRPTADMNEWMVEERLFCVCDSVCVCGWDDEA
jgi:hypothetical protein